MSDFILSQSDLLKFTGRARPTSQARILEELGIPYRFHPIDRTLIVSRAVVEAVLGGNETARETQAGECYEVDVEGIRRHGKVTISH